MTAREGLVVVKSGRATHLSIFPGPPRSLGQHSIHKQLSVVWNTRYSTSLCTVLLCWDGLNARRAAVCPVTTTSRRLLSAFFLA